MDLIHAIKEASLKNENMVVVSEEDTRLIQNRLLLVLDDILSVCDELDIPYQMGGGSALGTVRHRGFIPWDDDIDINMLRKDAERFLSAFKERFADRYRILVSGDPDNTFLITHIMTRDVRARDIMEPKNGDWGLCLDIFYIENTFDNPLLRKIHGYGAMGFRYVLSCLRFLGNEEELKELAGTGSAFAGYIRKRTRFAKFFSVIPLSVWSRWADRWLKLCRNDRSKYVCIPAGQKQYFGEMYERARYCELTEAEFEKRRVKISADYDAYLTKLYGNYMEIPPADKREQHILRELDREALKKYENLGREPL